MSEPQKRPRGRPRKVQAKADPMQTLPANPVVQSKYDAAGNGRRMRAWNPPSTGPNKSVQGIQTIRNRARDVRRNDWSGESGVQKWTTNLVGIGIVPRFKRVKSKERKQAILDLWNDFVATSDADGVLTLYGQQTLATTAWLSDGEVFIRRRDRRPDGVLPVPMQVQLIEAEFVPMLDADQWPGLAAGNRIRSGIELTRSGQRVAYWMYREHPGDNTGTASITIDKLIRVPAEQVRHMYMPARPGALRGVSPLAPVITRLRNVADFDDAVLERQKLANLFMAFIKWTQGNTAGEDVDPLTGLPLTGSSDSPLAGLAPGIVQELEPGQEVQFANPPEAGTMYGEYMRVQHMGTAAGQGLPYEVFSGDIKDVSDRTLRVIINEFRRFAEQRQWQIIIPMMCQPVIDWFALAAALIGKITAGEIEDVRRVEHAPHGWAHIHPVQDPQGKQMEVESGFRSRSSVIAERGDDPDQVDEERAADKEREEALGLAMDPADDLAQGDQDGIDNSEYSAPPNAMMQTLGRMEALMTVKAGDKPEPISLTINNHQPQTVVNNEVATPSVNVTNEVATPSVTVNNEVPAPNVNVTNEVKPAPVSVAAPTVNVHNEVKPAEVKVSLPSRKTETNVVRDRDGNIVRATQIETDADDSASN